MQVEPVWSCRMKYATNIKMEVEPHRLSSSLEFIAFRKPIVRIDGSAKHALGAYKMTSLPSDLRAESIDVGLVELSDCQGLDRGMSNRLGKPLMVAS